jgi:hypothetical protein
MFRLHDTNQRRCAALRFWPGLARTEQLATGIRTRELLVHAGACARPGQRNSTSEPIGRKRAARKARSDLALPGETWAKTGSSAGTNTLAAAIIARPGPQVSAYFVFGQIDGHEAVSRESDHGSAIGAWRWDYGERAVGCLLVTFCPRRAALQHVICSPGGSELGNAEVDRH